jgi:hypothetical protein
MILGFYVTGLKKISEDGPYNMLIFFNPVNQKIIILKSSKSV